MTHAFETTTTYRGVTVPNHIVNGSTPRAEGFKAGVDAVLGYTHDVEHTHDVVHQVGDKVWVFSSQSDNPRPAIVYSINHGDQRHPYQVHFTDDEEENPTRVGYPLVHEIKPRKYGMFEFDDPAWVHDVRQNRNRPAVVTQVDPDDEFRPYEVEILDADPGEDRYRWPLAEDVTQRITTT